MNILDFTAADLINYVESQFKTVVDSDYEDDDRAYRQKVTTAQLAEVVTTFEPTTHDSSAGNRRCFMRIGSHDRVSCRDGLATDGCNHIEDSIIEATRLRSEILNMLDDSCLVVIDDDCDWRSHETIMYLRNPGSDEWTATTVERNY